MNNRLTLKKARETNRLPDFIDQQEAGEIGAASDADFEKVVEGTNSGDSIPIS